MNRRISRLTSVFLVVIITTVLSACQMETVVTSNWDHSHSGLFDAAISSDGQYAVVSSFSDGASFWNLDTNSRLYEWRHDETLAGQIAHIAFATDNSHVITANERTFVIWETSSGRSIGYWSVEDDINCVALSDQAKHVLLGLKDGRAIHIDRQSRRRLDVVAHRNERIRSVNTSPDGKVAVTGGDDSRVMVWNTADGSEIHALQHAARITTTKLSRSSNRLFSADERGGAYIWDLESGQKLATLPLGRGQHVITAARFSRDGKHLLLGFPGRSVRLWNGATGDLVKSWRTPNRKNGWVPQGSTVYAVAFNAKETSVLAESSNGLGRSWQLHQTN
jgi:tricorn protease-like protein